MKIDLQCPVECQSCLVKTSPSTGDTYVMFKLFNLGDREIREVKLNVVCFDSFGKELARVPATLSGLEARPHDYFASKKAVSVREYPETKRATAEIGEITFADGDTYVPTGGTEVDCGTPDPALLLDLRKAAGEDAKCLSAQRGEYWLCVCGRANLPDAESCARCGRERAAVLEKYSSADAVGHELMVQAAHARAEQERRLAEERQRAAEQKHKRTIALRRTLVGIAALVVVAVLALLCYRGVVTIMAGSAAEDGDVVRAYDLYRSVGSKKAFDVQEGARGNSVSNLISSGFLAEDDEWLFYLDDTLTIWRESKADGTKQSLETQGVSLNVVGDWVYYVSYDQSSPEMLQNVSKIFKMRRDGSDKQPVSEDTVQSMSVIGSEIYYISQSGQEAGLVFRMGTDGKGKKQLSTSPCISMAVYKGYVYYVGQDQTISRVSVNGKDEGRVLKSSVIHYGIWNDELYYVEAGVADQTSGEEKQPMMKCKLDGTEPVPVRDDVQVFSFGLAQDGIYYIDMSNVFQLKYMQYDGSGETLIMPQITLMINVSDDWIYYRNEQETFARIRKDGTGMELIGGMAADGAAAQGGQAAEQ